MTTLTENSTIEEIKSFLLFHMDEANENKSKVNPSLTKQQVWDINMNAVLEGDIRRVQLIIIKNITREFGINY